MSDAERREEEALVLSSCYGDDFVQIDSEWILRWTGTDPSGAAAHSTLTILLPGDYPSVSPPDIILDVPWRAGLRKACREFLSEWLPGREVDEVSFTYSLAERFCQFCEEREVPGLVDAPNVELEIDKSRSAGPVAAVITLEKSLAEVLGRSLCTAGFQACGSEYINGEVGVGVEIGDTLHVSVDGVHDVEVLREWLVAQLDEGDLAVFGESLLKWAEVQRAADEVTVTSEAGDDPEAMVAQAGGVTLTGNAAWKARLQAGRIVEFRGGGNSLHPRIKSGECCQYLPVFKHEDIKVGNVVFCQIKGRYWGHIVKTITHIGGKDELEYTISNIHGWENGSCTLKNIFGKVIDHWKVRPKRTEADALPGYVPGEGGYIPCV